MLWQWCSQSSLVIISSTTADPSGSPWILWMWCTLGFVLLTLLFERYDCGLYLDYHLNIFHLLQVQWNVSIHSDNRGKQTCEKLASTWIGRPISVHVFSVNSLHHFSSHSGTASSSDSVSEWHWAGENGFSSMSCSVLGAHDGKKYHVSISLDSSKWSPTPCGIVAQAVNWCTGEPHIQLKAGEDAACHCGWSWLSKRVGFAAALAAWRENMSKVCVFVWNNVWMIHNLNKVTAHWYMPVDFKLDNAIYSVEICLAWVLRNAVEYDRIHRSQGTQR